MWYLLEPSILIALAAGGGILLSVVFVALGWRAFQGDREVLRNRLRDQYASELDALARESAERRLTSTQIAERLNELMSQRSFARRIAHSLEQANLPLTITEYLLLRAAVPLLLAGLAWWLWQNLLAILPAATLGFLLPEWWIAMRQNSRRQEFNAQLPETLTIIVNGLRGGFSLVQTLRLVAQEAREPTRLEFERTSQEITLGIPLADALDNLAQRMDSDDMNMVVTAIKINARVGGNLAEILQNISSTIRERSKLRQEVRVMTSMQRLSAWIVGLIPIGLALFILAVNPGYILVVFKPGWPILIPIIASVFWITGFIVIRRIANIRI
ncbi:MAG: type II secretion system F family protein [Chloroflexus sp.]|nr:type II secretion system F family protein [Chloroflexus sp.]